MDKGKSQVKKDKFADNFYNRGVYNSVLVAQAIRNAQKITGKKVVDGSDVRTRLETLNITEPTGPSSASRSSARRCTSPAPTTTATAPSSCSNGTARNGTGSPI